MAADDGGVPSPTAAYKVHLPRAGILNTPCKVGQLGIKSLDDATGLVQQVALEARERIEDPGRRGVLQSRSSG